MEFRLEALLIHSACPLQHKAPRAIQRTKQFWLRELTGVLTSQPESTHEPHHRVPVCRHALALRCGAPRISIQPCDIGEVRKLFSTQVRLPEATKGSLFVIHRPRRPQYSIHGKQVQLQRIIHLMLRPMSWLHEQSTRIRNFRNSAPVERLGEGS